MSASKQSVQQDGGLSSNRVTAVRAANMDYPPTRVARITSLCGHIRWDRRYFVLKFRRLFYYKDQAAFRAQNEPR